MTSTVPDEVLEIILSCLVDDNDAVSLKACALVSSVFLPIARSFLFNHVFLLPQPRQTATTLSPRSYSLAPPRSAGQPQPGPRSGSLAPCSPTGKESYMPEINACLKFLRLLSMSPALARHVKRLSVIDGKIFPSNDFSAFSNDTLFSALGLDDLQSPQYYATRDKLNGSQWFLATPPRALSLLLQKLKLRSFDLVFQGGPKVSWDEIPRDIHSALNLAFTSPSLRTLEIRGVSWDTPTSLRSLTNSLSQRSSITHLTLCNVKILSTFPDTHPLQRGRSLTPRPASPLHTHAAMDFRERKYQEGITQRQFNTHSPHAKPFFPLSLNISSQSQNAQNQHLMAAVPAPDSKFTRNAPSSSLASCGTQALPLLRLESLTITSTSDLGHSPSNASDTLDLLRVLFLNSRPGDRKGNVAQPLINPDRLKRLSIPSIDLDDLAEVLDTLTRSGVCTHIEELILNNKLGISASGSRNPPSRSASAIPDFSGFPNLRYLRLGIYAYPNRNATSPAQLLHTLPRASYPPSMLLWLTHVLDTVPLIVPRLSINISGDKRTLDMDRRDIEGEWRTLANSLRSRRSKYTRVSLVVHLINSHSGFKSGFAFGDTASPAPSLWTGTSCSRGRGRAIFRQPGPGIQNCEDRMDVDDKDIKTWFGDMFRGLDLKVVGDL